MKQDSVQRGNEIATITRWLLGLFVMEVTAIIDHLVLSPYFK